MVSLNEFIIQVFQPYFFYSLVFLSIAFITIKVFLKLNPNLSSKTKSSLWLLPLIIPLFVFSFFPPQSTISIPPSALPNQISGAEGLRVVFLVPNIISLAGLLCISGAILAIGYLVLMLVFGREIALKRFHVVMMAQEEYATLQQEVKKLSLKLGISEPKVGLVDDLLPNAFTLGYGRKTVVVFSLGLLEMLEPEELAAVASHELAHIKAKDYLFRTLSYSLNALSFFNPISYFAASKAQKERELLADEKSLTLLDKPILMQKVLRKLEKITPPPLKLNLADRLSSSLFLISPLVRRPGVLATHPQISQRMQNITEITSKQTKKPKTRMSTFFIVSILVCVTILAGYSTIQIGQTVIQNQNAHLMNGCKVWMYNSTLPNNATSGMGILFQSGESFLNFTSGQSGMYRFVET